jgi:hypothetical protein
MKIELKMARKTQFDDWVNLASAVIRGIFISTVLVLGLEAR